MQRFLEKTQMPKCDQHNHNHTAAVYCNNTALLRQETLRQCKIRWGKGALDTQTHTEVLVAKTNTDSNIKMIRNKNTSLTADFQKCKCLHIYKKKSIKKNSII